MASQFLDKQNILKPAEDYAAMRSSGISYIEQTGSDSWTNYNDSDPGITILEAVIYAITDLSYRTGFEIKDLLAPQNQTDNTWNEIFYSARNILHNTPVTINDYRKLIIDIEGVRNAWLEPSKEYEVPVWVNYNHFERKKESECSGTSEEFCMGKLDVKSVDPETIIPYYLERLKAVNERINSLSEKENKYNTGIQELEDQLSKDDQLDYFAKELIKQKIHSFRDQLFQIKSRKTGLEKEIEFIHGRGVTENGATDSFTPIESKIVEFEGLYNVSLEFEENITDENKREAIRQQVVQRLYKHRNLCEDFLSVQMVGTTETGMGAFINLHEDADPDVVLAEIFFAIYKYFTPSVPFYTIGEMIEKGFQTDEIFEGPALKHGFIDSSELEQTAFLRDLNLSDLIHHIANIPGVKAINYLHLPFDGFNDESAGNGFFSQWVYQLKEAGMIARIRPERSQIVFCKENETVSYFTGAGKDRNPNRMLKLFNDLKVKERKYKLTGIPLDLPIPEGENMELEDYYPVTYSLPMCYGVSERAGLPADADRNRKNQALQLKGYLLFFEQILYNYLVSLSHLRDIYTMDGTPTHTLFSGVLQDLQDIDQLIIRSSSKKQSKEELISEFSLFVQNLVEPREKFLKRRNQFFNHFLARFGENVDEYEEICKFLGYPEEKIMADKARILGNQEYKYISSNRGKAFNYAHPAYWDTGNVSGAERRISRLLGFKQFGRRSLSAEGLVLEPVMVMGKDKQLIQKTNPGDKPVQVIRFLSKDKEKTLLTSVEVSEGCCTEKLIMDILIHSDNPAHLMIRDQPRRRSRNTAGPVGSFWFEVYDDANEDTAVLLASSRQFENKTERDEELAEFKSLLEELNNNEGMHLLEHILLRPKMDEVLDENNQAIEIELPRICLQSCDLGIGVGEGMVPGFRKNILRIPAEKCYDNMPWVLNYLNKENNPVLFQKVTLNKDLSQNHIPLKFRKYQGLSKRVEDLDLYGSLAENYIILSNEAENQDERRYGFAIFNEKKQILAQSLYVYTRTKAESPKNPDDKNDIHNIIQTLIEYFGTRADWYCEPNACDNNEDPFSFRDTVILPCWPKRFRNPTFKNLVEKTILSEVPAHIHTRIVWVGPIEMNRFETVYYNWLKEISITELPSYEIVNPLIEVLNSLKPCGECIENCSHGSTKEDPASPA